MSSVTIRGVPVEFPFEPYEIQKDYMEKVLECLQNETNGVLESPTGTGKTLSLLCASLAWLQVKKAQLQAQQRMPMFGEEHQLLDNLKTELDEKAGKMASGRAFLGLPTIIYASRTHSQLSQAMQELKRTSYRHMKASVLGSRDQLCIHPEVSKETNSQLVNQMCQVKLASRSCHFLNRNERKKDDPAITGLNVVDIEDIVKLGQAHKFCPYYMTKELKQKADIIFMPYNYLLDPLARKALGVTLSNNVVILDEAHNVETVCQDAASMQVKTTDITLAIEEVTAVMKMIDQPMSFDDSPKDFTPDDLVTLKQMLLDFEKEMDNIELKNNDSAGTNFDGDYIFELLGKSNINKGNAYMVIGLIDQIIQYLITVNEGPFARKGNGIQTFADLLRLVFTSMADEFKQKIKECYKVHITVEEPKKGGNRRTSWFSKDSAKQGCRVLSYWCFSPGFGMNMVMNCGIRCVILTSGTLAPLQPLISELELNIQVRLENPHVIKEDQVCVKVVPRGPDMESLICNYQNRDNPKYISSIGKTLLNLSRIVPSGMLIFFPSYPIMQKYQQIWQQDGIWSNINDQKTIYVESRDKDSFNSTMTDYYAKNQDSNSRGAIFMGVFRGKIAEGLDFSDANGRAVIIIGLPYPPLKDPRVILKRQYLDRCNTKDRMFLKGEEWYSLEATRAVNQAIGRVIRHRHDYGAIIFLDERFGSHRIKSQMSLWLRNRIQVVNNFGEIIRDVSRFFRNAKSTLPAPQVKPTSNVSVPAEFEIPQTYKKAGVFDFSTSSISSCSSDAPDLNSNGSVMIHKRSMEDMMANPTKRKKIIVKPNSSVNVSTATTAVEYMAMVTSSLDQPSVKKFILAMKSYKETANFADLTLGLDNIFSGKPSLRYLIQGLEPYIKEKHRIDFKNYWDKIR